LLHGLCAVHPASCRLAGYKCVSAYVRALMCLRVWVCLFEGEELLGFIPTVVTFAV